MTGTLMLTAEFEKEQSVKSACAFAARNWIKYIPEKDWKDRAEQIENIKEQRYFVMREIFKYCNIPEVYCVPKEEGGRAEWSLTTGDDVSDFVVYVGPKPWIRSKILKVQKSEGGAFREWIDPEFALPDIDQAQVDPTMCVNEQQLGTIDWRGRSPG